MRRASVRGRGDHVSTIRCRQAVPRRSGPDGHPRARGGKLPQPRRQRPVHAALLHLAERRNRTHDRHLRRVHPHQGLRLVERRLGNLDRGAGRGRDGERQRRREPVRGELQRGRHLRDHGDPDGECRRRYPVRRGQRVHHRRRQRSARGLRRGDCRSDGAPHGPARRLQLHPGRRLGRGQDGGVVGDARNQRDRARGITHELRPQLFPAGHLHREPRRHGREPGSLLRRGVR